MRLKNYFTQWVKLSDMKSSFEGVVDLMLKEQFINSCSRKLSDNFMERKPHNFEMFETVFVRYFYCIKTATVSNRPQQEAIEL